MSRRSTRLLTKKQEGLSKKRKAEEEVDDITMQVNKRRQQFQIKNQWVPISNDSSVVSSTLVPTPEQTRPNQGPRHIPGAENFRFQNYFTTPLSLRPSPLPMLNWAESKDVWQIMLKKDVLYARDHAFMSRHPTLQSRMRAILLDWLIEVCEVYRLHRETYYLAVDFIDRFLGVQRNILKHQLQLIGITALFVAAKLEEIYPPKLAEFAYVTDGACSEEDILSQELIILKALKWDLAPMTVNSWLNVYLQLTNLRSCHREDQNFILPKYSAHFFIQVARLLDLCMLDPANAQFSYSVIAAAALYHSSSEEIALTVSGYKWMDIAPCVHWMSPFSTCVRESGTVELKFFPNVPHEETHNIQTHAVDIELLDKALALQEQIEDQMSRSSPDCSRQRLSGLLTPPLSSKKSVYESSV